MKTIRTLAFTMLAMAMVLLITPQKAQAGTDFGASFTNTATTITVKWTKPEIPEGYTFDYYYIKDASEAEPFATVKDYGITSYTLNESRGVVDRFEVGYYMSNAESSQKGDSVCISVNTYPDTLPASCFGITYTYPSKNKITVESSYLNLNVSHITAGVEMKIYKGSTCVKTISANTKIKKTIKVSRDKIYKYKCRIYYKNSETNQKYYGKWSSLRYFDFSNSKLTYNDSTRGCKVTLKRVTNVSKYVIYVSTSKDSGYKKTMTVKKPSSSTKTVRINKIGSKSMKKGKRYYVQVVPYIKVGSSLKKSDTPSLYTFKNSK